MSKYGINFGVFQGKIFVGRLNKANTQMLDDKEDHTLSAVESVGKYLVETMGNGATSTLELGNKTLIIKATIKDKNL